MRNTKPNITRILVAAVLAAALACASSMCDAAAATGKKVQAKSQAPVTVSWKAPARGALNKELQVTVAVTPQIDASDVTLRVVAEDGLDMATDFEGLFELGDISAGSTIEKSFSVTPTEDGRLYVDAFVSGSFSGKNMSMATSLPITVGNAYAKPAKSAGEVKTDSSGQKIIVMPAEEK